MKPILIVDDEEAIARLIARTLTNAGYPCRAVTDSTQAADLLEHGRYDLVLLDVMMPGFDGYTTCCAMFCPPAPPASFSPQRVPWPTG